MPEPKLSIAGEKPSAHRASGNHKTPVTEGDGAPKNNLDTKESVVIRFSGDSGDGMQLTGTLFTNTSAILGNDVSTFPDFPAEIRAPVGTVAGLSGFQVNFSSSEIYTAGDAPMVLVAMNPAALKANLGDLDRGGIIIVNTDAFSRNNLRKAGYEMNPLDDDTLSSYEIHRVPLTTLNRSALQDIEGLTNQQKDLCKNSFALGLTYWMFDRPLDQTLGFFEEKFAKRPTVIEANTRSLKAGYYFGETTEAFQGRVRVPRRTVLDPGTYRRVTGNEALVMGLVTASRKARLDLVYASYPITPASSVLEELAGLKHFGVRTFQAEDEIAAMGAAIGAAFGGALAVTASSGPGIALKSEGMNLAVVLELPMVIIDVQRGGPSTGLPTKTEQSDLLQVLFGRNGESPIPVLAASTPSDCFETAIEACRIAIRSMTPVVLISDGYLATGSEPWKIPDPSAIARIKIEKLKDPSGYQPYARADGTLARSWVSPGTAGFEHRIGGLGKQDVTGNVSYLPEDHEHMVRMRHAKVARIADFIPDVEVFGPERGDLLVLGWGGTFGPIRAAVERVQGEGKSVASAHLRHLNPFPKNLGEVLESYDHVLLPELNLGQLSMLIRAAYNVQVEAYNKVQGQPFKISEIEEQIRRLVG